MDDTEFARYDALTAMLRMNGLLNDLIEAEAGVNDGLFLKPIIESKEYHPEGEVGVNYAMSAYSGRRCSALLEWGLLMNTLSRTTSRVFSFCALFACCIVAATTSSPSQTTVKQIDTECNAIQNAVMALHPIHVALQSGTWNVMSDADYAVAMQTKAAITLADVWKQKSKYAWVHAHSIDSQGNQRATQLCFRQSDGTLERARQAKDVPSLAAASAQQAYYGSNGKVIQKTSLFEVNDPMLAKKIQALPFYSVLPK